MTEFLVIYVLGILLVGRWMLAYLDGDIGKGDIHFNEAVARGIVQMEESCFGEGYISDNTEALAYIRTKFPKLVKEYSFLPWGKY